MAMIRCEFCEKFFDGDWVEMFENPEDPCSMVCIDCYTEWEEDTNPYTSGLSTEETYHTTGGE